MSRLRRPGSSGTRLFLAYALASLVPMAVLGVVLAQSSHADAVESGLEHGRAQAAVVGEMAIAPALHGADLGAGLTEGERQRLQSATDLAIFRGSVQRMRLRDFDGAVVFSDDGALVATDANRTAVDAVVPPTDPAFRSAAAGVTAVAVLGAADERQVIRVLQPIVADSSGRSLGVLELVLPYDAVADQVAAATARTYWRIGAGLGLLYVVLGLVSWSTTRRLRRSAAEAAHDSLHDPLTGLPNREYFRRSLEQATRSRDTCAVVLVDLDRFKEVNDTLGHHAGDELLRVVGQRLTGLLRTDDTVARLGGDEFGLLLHDIGDLAAARQLVELASRELSAELLLDGVPLTIEASFGVALHPQHGSDVDELIRNADMAMYQSKRGTAGVVAYDPTSTAPSAPHLTLQHDMRRALENDELELVYQPKIELGSGVISGVEALLRWHHPERGLLMPGVFLPAVEHSGVMSSLTHWVLRQALADCGAWRALGRTWTVAVNVSARNLDHHDFARTVSALAAAAGIPPSALQLEVTETALRVDLGVASDTLTELAGAGFGISLDDFGVGYASLSHLRSAALTELKIDRSFVAGLGVHAADDEVVRSLIRLAHGLGLTVCAEGVETAQVRDQLRDVGCDLAQGYLFSRPVRWQALPPAPGPPAQAPRSPILEMTT